MGCNISGAATTLTGNKTVRQCGKGHWSLRDGHRDLLK
jgi:hypothetical protein